MWVFELINWKICLGAMIAVILLPLLFVPPSMWNETFWRYLNETPIIEWVGQLAWVFFIGALFSIAYVTTRELFG